MNAVHAIEACTVPGCPWEVDGPDAKTLADAHRHPTTSRTHPTTRCAQEGCHRA